MVQWTEVLYNKNVQDMATYFFPYSLLHLHYPDVQKFIS